MPKKTTKKNQNGIGRDSHKRKNQPKPTRPKPSYEPSFTKIALSVAEIDCCIAAMRATLGGSKIVGLDLEWDTTFHLHGMGKVATMQICYEDIDGRECALLFFIHNLAKLPLQLESLLTDASITFVGVNVTLKFNKIGRDFNIAKKIKHRIDKNIINLGNYARMRDVVQNGSVSLAKLCTIVLGQSLDESNNSNWAVGHYTLSDDQKKCAIIDALISRRLYIELEKMPVLTV